LAFFLKINAVIIFCIKLQYFEQKTAIKKFSQCGGFISFFTLQLQIAILLHTFDVGGCLLPRLSE
jgi:hypothetical protein